MNSVHGINSAPSFPDSVFSVTSRGEVMVSDPKVTLQDGEANGGVEATERRFRQELEVKGFDLPLIRVLENGFAKGSILVVKFTLTEDCQR